MEETLRSTVHDLQQALTDKNIDHALEILQSLEASPISATALAKTQVPIIFQRLRKESRLPLSIRTKCRDILKKWKSESYRELTAGASSKPKRSESGTNEEQKDPRASLLRRLTESNVVVTTNLYDAVEFEHDDSVGFDKSRINVLQKGKKSAPGPVIYWMQRDQRLMDNWALIHAQLRAVRKEQPLVVLFALPPKSATGYSTAREQGFLLRGLRQLEADLRAFNMIFRLALGNPSETVPAYAKSIGASAVITDFSPMKVVRAWKNEVASSLDEHVTFEEIDAHNIVPVWSASNQAEVGTRTMRKKIYKGLSSFLTDFPHVLEQPFDFPSRLENGCTVIRSGGETESGIVVKTLENNAGVPWTDWETVLNRLEIDWSVPEVTFCIPGERGAARTLDKFLHGKIESYPEKKHDPNKPAALSGLSPYLNYGHVAAQRIVLEMIRVHKYAVSDLFVEKQEMRTTGSQVFVDELVVRKELGDNFCYYVDSHDTIDGFPDWAKQSLEEHRQDPRPDAHSFEDLEHGQTNDDLWNASQMEMVRHGKMHPVTRQYWAKRLLELCQSPEEALEVALHLNDKYSIDGRDPLGIAGCASCVGGVHDMGAKEKEIYGKVRPMAYKACESKFVVKTYVDMHLSKRTSNGVNGTVQEATGQHAASDNVDSEMGDEAITPQNGSNDEEDT
eukprot:gb/GECG01003796.1/.p1 GENE.gb/GECG01003796.1/~~gb/GECG01003796.1/.p1  ORF type:complete len:676 (+),score=93.98 gb/GECG01003796.1/:1-2028(+)